eukprot:13470521-Alexandrium_andersonii.AAC.1
MALRRNASNTAASRLGIVCGQDINSNAVIKWELWCQAALVASMRAWYREMQYMLVHRTPLKLNASVHMI